MRINPTFVEWTAIQVVLFFYFNINLVEKNSQLLLTLFVYPYNIMI
ncbi:Uncharacterised protein [Mycobacteroides abscessus subsp. abscessus]|nr:Uncharacterised protein [Mycobacteroides abscessus subsp. abscessus]